MGAVGPQKEICDYEDNDCDGDEDEGFGIGSPCDLPGGCRGKLDCSEDHEGTRCIPIATSPEVCDGVDNDCDGLIDLLDSGEGLATVCRCAIEDLPLTPVNEECSPLTMGQCPGLTCTGADSGLILELSNRYNDAQCVSSKIVNLSSFDLARAGAAGELSGSGVVEIEFTVTSGDTLPCAVNLWYEQLDKDGKRFGLRKYFPLLVSGERPGHFVKRFTPDQVCFAPWLDCTGARKAPDCGQCAPDATCGEPSGDDCDDYDFTTAVLELVVEWCAPEPDFAGSVEVHRIRRFSEDCFCASDAECSSGLECRKTPIPSRVCGNAPCVGLCNPPLEEAS